MKLKLAPSHSRINNSMWINSVRCVCVSFFFHFIEENIVQLFRVAAAVAQKNNSRSDQQQQKNNTQQLNARELCVREYMCVYSEKNVS